MRAARLGLSDAPVQLAAETNLRNILTTLDTERPALVIIDSASGWGARRRRGVDCAARACIR